MTNFNSKYVSAFRSKLRIVNNTAGLEKNPDAAPEKLVMDLTVDDAAKMAMWLYDKVKEAKQNNDTIRVYKSREEYDEVPGFSVWGSLWDKSGSMTPPPVKTNDFEDEEL